MTVFDLKSNNKAYHCSKKQHKELAYEQWQNGLLSIDGFYPDVRIQSQCKKIQRELQNSNVYGMESLSVYGICSAYGKRKPQRSGCMPECDEAQALSYGLQMQNCSKYDSLQQRKTRLEDLCEFRSNFNSKSKQTLCKRKIRNRTIRNRLCPRFFDNRSLSFSFSMGKIPKEKRGCKATYIIKSERKYPLIYQNYRWQSSRCEHPRRIACRTRILLCDGSWVFRFYEAFQNASVFVILRNPFKEKFFISQSLFQFGRQINWIKMRSGHSFDWSSNIKEISGTVKTNQILRQRKKQNFSIFNKQFFGRCTNHCPTLQMPVANRTFLQMDKTTFENQSVLWDKRKCSEIANMDSYFNIRPGCNREKRVKFRDESLHNFTNFECCFFRESSSVGTTYKRAA